MKQSKIADFNLAQHGHQKIGWVKENMPILKQIEEDFNTTKPFKDLRVLVCVHLEAKTAYLAKVFAAGGATVSVTGSNALSTKDDVASALAEDGLFVYAKHGATDTEMHQFIHDALDLKPNIIIDDGGDIVEIIHEKRSELIPNILGACEETTSGVTRAKVRSESNELQFPIILINDAQCKYIFDNYHGTGQSVWDGIMRTTNLVIAGKTVVVIGFGWCGKGIALRAKGLGANVIVTEKNPIKAVDATMHGYRVMPLNRASDLGDIFITATGEEDALTTDHFIRMKHNTIITNAGHFNTEINMKKLEKMVTDKSYQKENITGYTLENGRTIHVLGDGNLVNIACGDGHPAEIMDTSFALQALSAEYVVNNHKTLKNTLYHVPNKIDRHVAELRLSAMGVEIDR